MSLHWIHTMLSSRISCFSRAKATAKRLAVGLLVLVSLPALSFAEIYVAPTTLLDAAGTKPVELGERVAISQMLDDATLNLEQELHLRDWVIHPDGYAFRVPVQMTQERVRGVDVMLRDTQSGAKHQAAISIVLSDEEESFENLSRDKLKSAYSSLFQRFELTVFQQESLYNEEGLRLTFLSGSSPQLLVHQRIFNKNGFKFVLTLTVENKAECLMQAFGQFNELCDSLLFCESSELMAMRRGKK